MYLSDNQSDVRKVYDTFSEYCNAYQKEWERLDMCERLYIGKHWDDISSNDPNEPRPVTPLIQSTIENVRAELTDWFPSATVTADSPEYAKAAETVTKVIRENHINCNYEAEYQKLIYDLLVGGYMVHEVGFDCDMNNGLGGTYLRHVDNRCIMFDPNAVRVEDCRAIIKFAVYPMSWYLEHYPKQATKMQPDELSFKRTDSMLLYSDKDSAVLIEYWFRTYDPDKNKYNVHMLKTAGHVILEDSRTIMKNGMYAHGQFPFTLTTLFMRKGSCLGYGFADMFEKQQRFSDKLDQIVLKNALMASRNKLLVSNASGFDVSELCDWSKEVHSGENLNGVRWFQTAPLPAYVIDYIDRIRNSVHEESGANDFSRGTTFGGVTAASAINALQEMSNKRSRTIAKSIHMAFAEAVRLELEVEKQYSSFSRSIILNGSERVNYSNKLFSDSYKNGFYPIEFKVSVRVERESKFSVLSQNETILKLVQMGMLTPEIGLSMLTFEGKEEAMNKMKELKNNNEGAENLNGKKGKA